MIHDQPECSGLEEQLARALDLNSGKMRIEDFFDWESTLENYFEWKPMADERKILFVKLKLKGITLHWW